MAWIPMIDRSEAEGDLREAYRVLGERKLPPAYQPPHGGAAGIQRAHSLEPALMRVVFGTFGTFHAGAELSWAERELIASVASRTAQCFY